MTFVSWDDPKWAAVNQALGLKRNEICPRVTVVQHAESLAMFELKDFTGTNSEYTNRLIERTEAIVTDLTSGYEV